MNSVWDEVITDMKARNKLGESKYGKALHANDGRLTLQDAYEECLDMAVYLKKQILEKPQLEECMKLIRDFPGHWSESEWNAWMFRRDAILAKTTATPAPASSEH